MVRAITVLDRFTLSIAFPTDSPPLIQLALSNTINPSSNGKYRIDT